MLTFYPVLSDSFLKVDMKPLDSAYNFSWYFEELPALNIIIDWFNMVNDWSNIPLKQLSFFGNNLRIKQRAHKVDNFSILLNGEFKYEVQRC